MKPDSLPQNTLIVLKGKCKPDIPGEHVSHYLQSKAPQAQGKDTYLYPAACVTNAKVDIFVIPKLDDAFPGTAKKRSNLATHICQHRMNHNLLIGRPVRPKHDC